MDSDEQRHTARAPGTASARLSAIPNADPSISSRFVTRKDFAANASSAASMPPWTASALFPDQQLLTRWTSSQSLRTPSALSPPCCRLKYHASADEHQRLSIGERVADEAVRLTALGNASATGDHEANSCGTPSSGSSGSSWSAAMISPSRSRPWAAPPNRRVHHDDAVHALHGLCLRLGRAAAHCAKYRL